MNSNASIVCCIYLNTYYSYPFALMKASLRPLLLLSIPLLMDSCGRPQAPAPPASGDTYRPVYATYTDVRTIKTLPPQPLKNVGKIYVKDNYLFVSKPDSGLHVFDNTNPKAPIALSFIRILGNKDIAIKDSILYADNLTDLVALNIADPTNIRVVNRLENIFPNYPSSYPAFTGIRFECPDPARGPVISWEKAVVENPQCYR